MKKQLILATGLALALNIPSGLASSPCEVVLCMSKPSEGGSECRDAIRKFFSIVEYDDGDFDPSDTRKAREKYLKQCPGADSGFINKIISKYGSKEG